VRKVTLAAVLLLAPAARPDTVNFELNGHLYTKYMYQNDSSQGCLSISNPFWVDNIQGHNGACTEFELNIKGRVSDKVSAGVRLQSRWGAIWQDWWENGDLKPGVQDTSGESLGMNHAQYIKLRGAFIRLAPPIPTVSWVTLGSTDFSMWNEWTIGKARYIDRDNGDGVFVEGNLLPNKMLSYTTGAMALPKLWAGPGWQTGLKDNDPLAALYGTDWAFAAKLDSRPRSDLRLRLIGTLVKDWEADRNSPFLTGPASAARGANHSVALATRFRGANATVDGTWSPPARDWVQVSGLVAYSSNYVNPDYATNLVRNGQGFSPVLFKTDCPQSGCTPQDLANGLGNPVSSNDFAGTLLFEFFDPFKTGFSAKLQLFDIGAEYNAIMGSRREADVLITDGIIAGGFTRGGQLPTLNIANEFQDFDEPWYESCIGWRGATAILEYGSGSFKSTLEGTYIGYNTNTGVDEFGVPVQRDVTNQYPNFLYTNGFTDTTAFTADADYANVYDRGKDPRSVYAQYQDRHTVVAVLTAQYQVPGIRGTPTLNVKAKYVNDYDGRRQDRRDDDYRGKEYLGLAAVSVQPTNELKLTVGHELSYWDEAARDGSEQAGFYGSKTVRNTSHLGVTYAFGGALFSYTLEYFNKYLRRDQRAYYDMEWNVWRAKGTFEVGW